MKVTIALLGMLFCLTVGVGAGLSQGAPPGKAAPAPPQSLTGCVDEQFGQYVLLDGQMVKITGLQSAGSNKDVFAKYVGHQVQLKGTKSAGPKATFVVTGIEQIADVCGPAK